MITKKIKKQLQDEVDEINNISVQIKFPSDSTMSLTVEEIFDLKQTTNNSSFTKKFIHNNNGQIPVYGASKNADDVSYGYVADNLPNIKYFSDILTWNIDGSVGKANFREGKFSLSEKVIPLILQEKWKGLIDVIYVKYVLEAKAIEAGLCYGNKAGKARIKELEIEIPCKTVDGEKIPDYSKQKELAQEYQDIKRIKQQLSNTIFDLSQITVEI